MKKLTLPTRLVFALAALLLLLLLLPLVELRPALPALHAPAHELDAAGTIRALLDLAAWGLAIALILWFFHACIHALLHRAPPRVPYALHRDTLRDRRQSGTEPRPPKRNPLRAPYVLTLAPRPAAPASAPAASAAVVATALVANKTAVADRARAPLREPAPVAIKLLGPPLVEGLPKRRRGLRGESRQLLYYLALHPNGASREQLLASLWPDQDDKRARQHLYQAAADLRAHLDTAFLTNDDSYQLDRSQLSIDIDQLETLLQEAQDPNGRERRARLEQAVELIRGEPLAGLDHPWTAGEARHLHATIVDLLEQVGYARLDDGEPAAALHAAEQAIELDQLNENLWQLAMQAEAALGLREAVIARFDSLSQLLDRRLGLQPQKETRALYLSLLGPE